MSLPRRRAGARVALLMLAAWLASGLGALGIAPGAVGVARAAEYTMTTAATYEVLPDERRVDVAVAVTFVNTTPDPAGQFSVFETIEIAIHDGASSVAARDASGALTVSVAKRAGVNVATVRPRTPVRYNGEATFTLTYALADGATSQVRVRPSVIVFPAWGFGTASQVTVSIPSDYEVAVDGDQLAAAHEGAAWKLTSGTIDDPTSWLAMVTATRPSAFATLTAGVPLASGTVDLQVRAWEDDSAWGERTLAVLTEALPLLEEEIGVDYPNVGPLVIVESLPGPTGGLDEPVPSGAEIAVGFNEPPFTLLHQAAHLWLTEELASDRWITEGFASHAAAVVAAQMEVDPPFDPAKRTAEQADDAFPLVSWGHGETTPGQEAYAYAASWAAADRIASAVGAEALRSAWQRIQAGIGPYDPASPAPGGASHPVAVGARGLLDQLETVSDAEVAPIFADLVLDEASAASLDARATARAAYRELVDAAGGWGAPEPIRQSLAGWSFDDAMTQIGAARSWLADRDTLLAEIEDAGLTAPQRLRDRWIGDGGGNDARNELAAESAVVGAYREVADRNDAERSIVERVGLLGTRDPGELLAQAGAMFADGELRGAADTIELARARLDAATSDGIVRLISAAAIVLAGLALVVWLVRRRRTARGTDYTAQP